VPKDVKLSILNIVEASPVKKSWLVRKLGMTPIKYYRWAQKYYLDNSLEDKRGGYKVRRPRLEDLYRKQIIDIRKNKFLGKAIIGPERIMDALEEEGIFLSHETIRKVLHQEGLIVPRPRQEIHEYKRFEADYPNDLWQTDFLYLHITGIGYYFLCSILDDYSRKIIYWQLTATATAKEAIATLRGAISNANCLPKRVLTDRGTQFFTGIGKKKGHFELFLQEKNIQHSVARIRHPQTLGKIERYHRSLRQECLNHYDFDDPIETRRIIREYVHNYNTIRKHKGIGRVTPESRYLGEDKEIRLLRRRLRQEIITLRHFRFNDPLIDQEIAVLETVGFVKNALKKEVIIA